MNPSDQHRRVVRSLHAVQRELERRFVGRAAVVAALNVAVVAREHMLLLGPPGTAKTELLSRHARLIQARRFSYLLTRFTEPAEVFGPLDFELFQSGTYRIKTTDMLPEAEIVFLDEVFQGSSAILNTLLALINERRFHNGARIERTPLISLFGASSELPEDPALQAFSDRFLLRMQVEPVGGARLTELLELGWEQEQQRSVEGADPAMLRMDELTALTDLLPQVDLAPVRTTLADLLGELLAQGVTLSDRRIVRSQRLIAAAALLRESGTAAPRDLWPLAHLWTEATDAAALRDAVHERVTADGGEPITARRSPVELGTLAQHEASMVLNRSGTVPRGSVIAALRSINELLTDARTHHPAAFPTHEFIIQQRDRVSQLLEPAH